MAKPQPLGLWDLLRKMASRSEGFSTAEVLDRSSFIRAQVGVATGTLRERGELVSLRISHKYARYFATQAQADTYQAARYMPTTRHLFPDRGVNNLARKKTPPRVVAQWAPDAEATIPDHVKVQVGPSHPPRNEMHEFPFLHTRRGL